MFRRSVGLARRSGRSDPARWAAETLVPHEREQRGDRRREPLTLRPHQQRREEVDGDFPNRSVHRESPPVPAPTPGRGLDWPGWKSAERIADCP
ncbi:hypothetical protein QJS66_09810 [Kocuria rhizophila]|nr:hypothetical protein QJS66_09810 [Kocuria rhizophila]